MTPAEKLGYKEGHKFTVVSDEGSSYYKIGMTVVLVNDDDSEFPWFKYVNGPKGQSLTDLGVDYEFCVNVEDIKPLDKPMELLDTKAILKKYIEVKYPSDTFLQFLVVNS